MADKLNIQFRIKAIDNFSATMAKLDAKLKKLKGGAERVNFTVDVDVDVNEDKFNRAMDNIRDRTQRVNDKVIINTEVDGDTDLINRLRNIQDETQRVTDHVVINTDVDGDRDLLSRLRRIRENLPDEHETVHVDIETDVDVDRDAIQRALAGINRDVDNSNKRNRIKLFFTDFGKDFQNKVSRLASISRNVGELMQHYLIGGLVNLVPMLSPVIASTGAALGSLLPIIGTLGAGIMGLGTSFGLAGAGAVAYGILAGSVLGDVFSTSKKMAELQEKLNNTTDEKERIKILEKMSGAVDLLTDSQQKAMGSLNNMKTVWGGIREAMEPQIVTTFGTAMDSLAKILELTTPMFESVVKHADNLMNAFAMNIDSADFQAFIDLLNTQAGPAMETIFKALGNFAMGIANLMTAFGPMSKDMGDGFLGMSDSFRKWTASLADSEKFNAFVDYAKENLPKLSDIFGSLIKGLVSMGEAFAPYAADMLTGLQDLMNRFQEFSAGMKTNDGFQKFIDYATENGPVVISLIGELVKFIVNLGEAFAPVGEVMLKFNDAMFEIINTFMDAHPTFMKIFAAAVALFGIFVTHIPTMVLFSTITSRIGPVIGTIIAWIGKWLPKLGGLGRMIVNLIPRILNIGLTIGRLGTPIGLIITAVILLATTIYKNWDSIKKWTADMFRNMLLAFTNGVTNTRNKFNEIKSAITNVIDKIDLKESGKKIIQGLIDGITGMIGAAGKAIGKVAEKVRGFLPFSPAKEGPLRDINKLNFAGPITDSIYGDSAAIQRAMGSVLNMPDVSAGSVNAGTYAARSTGFAKQDTQSTDIAELVKVLTSDEHKGDVVLAVDGYELARVQRKHNDQLQGSRLSLMTAVTGV